ncbi:MAG TPA: hypothetical protein GXZ87_03115 [Bacteroidales bacterium]|nr:hypothetical protein [Bacteroidales bacterium]
MKKLTLKLVLLTALVVAFASCKKDPDYSLILAPSEINTTFGGVHLIKAEANDALKAEKVFFTWSSKNPEVASVVAKPEGGEVTANRIGETEITYATNDKKIAISKSVKVTVVPRTNLLNGYYFKVGASESDIQGQLPSGFSKNTAESTNTHLVYTSDNKKITKLIYGMKNGKLENLYVILSEDSDNEAIKYLEERFFKTNKIDADNILYYKNTGVTGNTFPINSVAGIFTNLKIGDKTYPLGVKVMDGAGF